MKVSRVSVLGLVCALGACQKEEAPAAPRRAAEVMKAEAKMAKHADPVAAAAPRPPESSEKAAKSGLLKSIPARSEGQLNDVLGGSKGGDLAHALNGPSSVPTVTGSSVGASGVGGLGMRGLGSGGGGSISLGGMGTLGAGRGSGMGVGYGNGGPRGAYSGAAEVVSGSEDYGEAKLNPWTLTERDHLSTFAVDVDTASYTLGRRKLLSGELPPAASVRVEEWLNYFRYRYPQPEKGQALTVQLDAAPSPFTAGKHLLRVGVQGRSLDLSERKAAHLTFLVDVSGSMQGADRLPLAKRALRLLVDQLHDGDTVALVTYAGNVRVVLPHTGMEQKAKIHQAIEDLSAGGSTAMGSGIELAYQQALKVLDGKSISRVIILSDGDANVGKTSHEEILETIEGHVKEGVTVTTVGFGMGNYKSVLMEQFADKGNGNHFYVDSLMAARRIFVEQLGGTLQVIAQDVKLQVDFDARQVNAYRLIGYENRDIADRDFRNDKVDAGEIGSGHTVTALYEVDLKEGAGAGLVTVRLRAKEPRGTTASEKAFVFPQAALAARFEDASVDLRFATAVMAAAEIFRGSPDAAEWSYGDVMRIARDATPPGNAERQEFLSLLEHAQSLAGRVARR
ncbi:MAG: von Willebrand factor type A domain-containing protein [Myxococcota bacterium]